MADYLQFTFPRDQNGRPADNLLSAYVLSEWTDLTADPIYKSSITHSGQWYINKIDQSGGSSKFIFGKSGYEAAWADKANLTYELIHTAFEGA